MTSLLTCAFPPKEDPISLSSVSVRGLHFLIHSGTSKVALMFTYHLSTSPFGGEYGIFSGRQGGCRVATPTSSLENKIEMGQTEWIVAIAEHMIIATGIHMHMAHTCTRPSYTEQTLLTDWTLPRDIGRSRSKFIPPCSRIKWVLFLWGY